MRVGDCKLHLYHEEWQLDGGREKMPDNRAVELYRVSDDPGERRDLAAAEPARRDALLAEMLAWMQRSGARLPSERNLNYDAAPAPQSFGPDLD